MSSKSYCFWFHQWSKWEVIEKGKIVRQGTKRVIGYSITQQRVCLKCDKLELRNVRSTIFD